MPITSDERLTPANLGYFVIAATDLTAWRDFAVDIVGMRLGACDTSQCLALRLDEMAQRFVIEQAEEDDLSAVGWELENEHALEALAQQISDAGLAIEPAAAELCARRRVEALFICTDPNGLRHELYFGPAMATIDHTVQAPVLRSEFVAGELGAGHFVAAARDKHQTDHFYRQALGLRVSDYIRGEVAPGGPVIDVTFLHARTGRHHSVAFAAMPPGKRVHHLMVEVSDMNDVGLAWQRCKEAGVPLMMELGRHPNDHMFSFYAVTPGGFGLEIGSGGIVIDGNDWKVRSYTWLSDWGHHAPKTN